MGELLHQQLLAKEAEFRSKLPDAHDILEQSVAEMRQAGMTPGLQAGERAPDFALKDAFGHTVALQEELAKGPVILTFYRGGWCPFCNLQLRAYQERLSEFRELGASLIAITLQSPDYSLQQLEKEPLSFFVASDMNGHVASQYRVLYEVSGALRDVYEKIGIDLAKRHGSEAWMLPLTATYLIDQDSTIRYAHVDPNFRRRLEPDVIMEELRRMKQP